MISKNNEPIDILKNNIQKIQKQFQVKELSLFGSATRDELTQKSDIDVLVEFNSTASFDLYMDLKFHLEDLFDRKVDLVTEKALRDPIKSNIQQELICVTR